MFYDDRTRPGTGTPGTGSRTRSASRNNVWPPTYRTCSSRPVPAVTTRAAHRDRVVVLPRFGGQVGLGGLRLWMIFATSLTPRLTRRVWSVVAQNLGNWAAAVGPGAPTP